MQGVGHVQQRHRVAIKVAIVLLVIGFGIKPTSTRDNWVPFIPEMVTTGETEAPSTGCHGRPARGACGLLRLHRIRRRLHGGPGGQEPAARSAHRHPGLAGSSARCSTSLMALVMTGIRARTPRSPSRTPCSCRASRRRPRSSSGSGYLVNIGAVAGLVLRGARDAHGAAAHLLHAWPATACCRRSSARVHPEVPDALHLHHHHVASLV
jgi:hypothetical protein